MYVNEDVCASMDTLIEVTVHTPPAHARPAGSSALALLAHFVSRRLRAGRGPGGVNSNSSRNTFISPTLSEMAISGKPLLA